MGDVLWEQLRNGNGRCSRGTAAHWAMFYGNTCIMGDVLWEQLRDGLFLGTGRES
jgi:hypothetical protein